MPNVFVCLFVCLLVSFFRSFLLYFYLSILLLRYILGLFCDLVISDILDGEIYIWDTQMREKLERQKLK